MPAVHDFVHGVPSADISSMLVTLFPWSTETDEWIHLAASYAARAESPVDVVPVCLESGGFNDKQWSWLAGILERTDSLAVNIAIAAWLPARLSQSANHLPVLAWVSHFQARNFPVVLGMAPEFPYLETFAAHLGVLGSLNPESLTRTFTLEETLVLAHRRLVDQATRRKATKL